MNDDERLQQTFEHLRGEDARRVPPFDAVRRKRPRRASPWAVVLPLASVMAVAAALVVWRRAPDGEAQVAAPLALAPASPHGSELQAAAPVAPAPASPRGSELAPPVDDAPLDFLLDVPGLRGAPSFDTSLLRGSIR